IDIAEPRHALGTARVLPHDRVGERAPALALPQNDRLALVGDADRGHVAGSGACRSQRLVDARAAALQDLAGVMLDPPRARRDLAVLLLRDRDDAPGP